MKDLELYLEFYLEVKGKKIFAGNCKIYLKRVGKGYLFL